MTTSSTLPGSSTAVGRRSQLPLNRAPQTKEQWEAYVAAKEKDTNIIDTEIFVNFDMFDMPVDPLVVETEAWNYFPPLPGNGPLEHCLCTLMILSSKRCLPQHRASGWPRKSWGPPTQQIPISGPTGEPGSRDLDHYVLIKVPAGKPRGAAQGLQMCPYAYKRWRPEDSTKQGELKTCEGFLHRLPSKEWIAYDNRILVSYSNTEKCFPCQNADCRDANRPEPWKIDNNNVVEPTDDQWDSLNHILDKQEINRESWRLPQYHLSSAPHNPLIEERDDDGKFPTEKLKEQHEHGQVPERVKKCLYFEKDIINGDEAHGLDPIQGDDWNVWMRKLYGDLTLDFAAARPDPNIPADF